MYSKICKGAHKTGFRSNVPIIFHNYVTNGQYAKPTEPAKTAFNSSSRYISRMAPIVHLLKIFESFYGDRKFVIVFTKPSTDAYPKRDQSIPCYTFLSFPVHSYVNQNPGLSFLTTSFLLAAPLPTTRT